MTHRLLRAVLKLSHEERGIYIVVLGFWFAILGMLWAISTGRWP